LYDFAIREIGYWIRYPALSRYNLGQGSWFGIWHPAHNPIEGPLNMCDASERN
jgi:hypothetical protein